jgi:hypothetical protein
MRSRAVVIATASPLARYSGSPFQRNDVIE